MLAARAATEIVSGDQNLGVAIGRLVEDEIGVLAAVVLVALFREQALAKPGTLDGLQVLLGNHHVGIDIDDLQRRCDAFQRGEFFHGPIFICARERLAGLQPKGTQTCDFTGAFTPIAASGKGQIAQC